MSASLPKPKLFAAVAAHRDDAELDAVAVAVHEREHPGQQGRVDVAQRATELFHRDDAHDRTEGESQHFTPAGGAQGDGGGILIVPVPRHGGGRLIEQQGRRARGEFSVVLEPRDGFRDAFEQHSDELRARQHLREPVPSTRGVAQ